MKITLRKHPDPTRQDGQWECPVCGFKHWFIAHKSDCADKTNAELIYHVTEAEIAHLHTCRADGAFPPWRGKGLPQCITLEMLAGAGLIEDVG